MYNFDNVEIEEKKLHDVTDCFRMPSVNISIFLFFLLCKFFTGRLIFRIFQLQFWKSILHLRKCTPNYILYGEMGRLPLSIYVNMRMVGVWNRLVSNEHKLSYHLYRLMVSLHNSGVHKCIWITFAQNIFNDTGFHYIFNFQGISVYIV